MLVWVCVLRVPSDWGLSGWLSPPLQGCRCSPSTRGAGQYTPQHMGAGRSTAWEHIFIEFLPTAMKILLASWRKRTIYMFYYLFTFIFQSFSRFGSCSYPDNTEVILAELASQLINRQLFFLSLVPWQAKNRNAGQNQNRHDTVVHFNRRALKSSHITRRTIVHTLNKLDPILQQTPDWLITEDLSWIKERRGSSTEGNRGLGCLSPSHTHALTGVHGQSGASHLSQGGLALEEVCVLAALGRGELGVEEGTAIGYGL